jgi:hypothetical protein
MRPVYGLCLTLGGKCGSTYIDRNFNQWMIKTFGEAYTSLPLKRRGPGSEFMRSFEVAKRSFGSEEAQRAMLEIDHIHMDTFDCSFYDSDEGCVLLPWYDHCPCKIDFRVNGH